MNSNQLVTAQSLFILGAGNSNGKSVIMLSLMEMLAGQSGTIGFFRPVVMSGNKKDDLIQLVSHRYQLNLSYEAMYGIESDEAYQLLADDQYDELLKIILGKYRSLQNQCQQVLCLGTDYSDGDTLFEFEFNAQVANNLGCLLMPVIHGGTEISKINERFNSLKHALHEQNCEVVAAVINGVAAEHLDAVRSNIINTTDYPVYLVPVEPSLERPTVGNIAHQLDAHIFSGDSDTLSRDIAQYKVAAMLVPDFLDHLEKDDLIITPGDRSDILIAALMAYRSTNYPQIAGMVLTGQQRPAPQVEKLIDGLGSTPFAVIGVADDTFTTALEISKIRARLYSQDKRKITKALGLVERSINLPELQTLIGSQISHKRTPLMFEYDLLQTAKALKQHIVLPEGTEERILRAAEILLLRDVVTITLLGNETSIRQKIQALALNMPHVNIIDPETSPLRNEFAQCYFEARKHKCVAYNTAYDLMADVSYFGTMLIHKGYADGMVSGAVHTTQHTIRPAFEIIKTKPGVSIVSSVFFMCLEDKVLVYGDCAVNPDPNAEQLANIAISAADTAQMFNIEPRVAMLSYSTGDSGKGEAVDKVREAVKIAQGLRPDLMLEGPMQYDAAVDVDVAQTKLPNSQVAGHASVLIFPDLNTGNNTYKAVQRSSGAIAVGPILQGLNKPVNDLSRGCTVQDIVSTVIITAIQAQQSKA